MVADLNAAVVMQIEKEIKDAQKTIHSAYVLFYKLSRVMENATDRLNGTLGEFEMSLREVRQNVSLARNEFVNMLKEVWRCLYYKSI